MQPRNWPFWVRVTKQAPGSLSPGADSSAVHGIFSAFEIAARAMGSRIFPESLCVSLILPSESEGCVTDHRIAWAGRVA
jgi:hypothetical protein